MERVIREQRVGQHLVQVVAVTRTESFIGGASEQVTDYVIAINRVARHDLAGIGMGPDELLQMGVEAAQGGY